MQFPELKFSTIFKHLLKSALGEDDDVFIIGGGMIYKEAMAFADELYITEVHISIEDADTYFPEIDRNVWKEVSRSEKMRDEESGYEFQFVHYERK